MIKKYTAEERRDLYKNLPKKLQNLFWEDDIADRLEKIYERFKLSHAQRLTLMEIIAHLFLGVLPVSQIKTTVEKEIGLGEDDSEKLAKEIVRFIVYPVQHILREVYNEEEFRKIGVRSSFHEEDKPEKGKENDFGDAYREPIE